MSRVTGLVRACHPGPTVAVTGIATALAQAAGARTGWVAAAFLSGQLTTGWTNDWRDRDRDRVRGRTDKPLVQGALTARALGGAALVAAVACVPLSLLMGVGAGLVHLVAVASAASYNLRLKATALSFLPYAVSFGLVPSVVTLSADGTWAPWWGTSAGALLGVGAHVANALPDLADDLATGVRGMPQRLGPRRGAVVMAAVLLAATALLVLGPGRPGAPVLAGAVVALVLTAVAVLRAGARTGFLAAVGVAVVGVALLVARGAALTGG